MIFILTVIAGLVAVFCLTLASFAWQDLAIGLVLATGMVALFAKTLFPQPLPRADYVAHIITYAPVFLWMLFVDVVKGTWQVASIVVGLRPLHHPGIVKIPLGNHSPAGVGIVGLLVTISPGSFMVDIDWEERVMLVHFIEASNPDKLVADVEKYYRLWEYGTHLPRPALPTDEQGER
jgi:multisubunit Na+/H+ antiporter MnhE subunit